MEGKVSINPAALSKSVEVSLSFDGGTKKPEIPAQVEGVKLPLVYNERLAEILLGFGLKASDENIGILRLLYENGFGLTKENFFKMNHAFKLTGVSDKALFMYENNMKLSTASLAVLDGFVSGKTKITQQLTNLADAINEVKDPATKAKLTEVFTREKEALEELLPKAQNGKQNLAGNTSPITVEKLTAQAAAHQINIAYLGKFRPSNAEGMMSTVAAENTASKEAAESGAKKTVQTNATPKEAMPLSKISAVLAQQLSESKTPLIREVSYENLVMEIKPQTQAKTANSIIPLMPSQSENEPQPQPALSAATQTQQSSQETSSTRFGNLLFRPDQSNPLEISRYIESLRSRLIEIIQTLRDNPDPASGRVVQTAREILSNIDFSSQIRNQIYVQLPYAMGDGHTDVSLHVFKDAKKASASDGRGISSAFLSLETASLGLFEAYVQKKDKSIHLQFRLKNEETISLVRENIARLDTLLGENKLSLASYSFTKCDEAFTLLDKPKKLGEEGSSAILAGDEIPQFDELA